MTEQRIDLILPAQSAELDDDTLAALYAVADRSMPWLRVNFVSSIDGAATRSGLSGGLSSLADKRVFDVLRRLADAVMVGAGTVRSEGYGPMRLDARSARWREENGLPPHPVFVIVSGALRLDPASRVFTEAPVRPIVLTTTRAPRDSIDAMQRVADVVVCGDDGIDPDVAQRALLERELRQVLCEGGPTLFGSLLAADAVDELCLTISPTLEAGDAPRIARGALPDYRRMALEHALLAGESLLLRYTRTA
jgi:riboflavin-specific deaminase-like protein